MLYVQQSLSDEEEILLAARFHWMYTVKAVFWIVVGVALGISIGYGAIWWSVSQVIRDYYPGIPDELYDSAWAEVVQSQGGYLKILWSLEPIIRFSILGVFLISLLSFANMMLVKATTEIAITSERLVYKKGLVSREVGELSISSVEGVSISQSTLGRIFGYGRVSIRGIGVGEVILPPIEDPILFRKVVLEARLSKERGDDDDDDDRGRGRGRERSYESGNYETADI